MKENREAKRSWDWDDIYQTLSRLSVGEEIKLEGFTWKRFNEHWLEAQDGNLYDVGAAANATSRGFL